MNSTAAIAAAICTLLRITLKDYPQPFRRIIDSLHQLRCAILSSHSPAHMYEIFRVDIHDSPGQVDGGHCRAVVLHGHHPLPGRHEEVAKTILPDMFDVDHAENDTG